LNEKKLSEIEEQRRRLQMEREALELEMSKPKSITAAPPRSRVSDSRQEPRLTSFHDKKEGHRSRKDEKRDLRGTDCPVKRVEMNDIKDINWEMPNSGKGRDRSRRNDNVEWITQAEMGTDTRVPRSSSHSSEQRHFDRRKVDQQDQVQWELPPDKAISYAKMEMERQEEQLSAREQDILDRMWTIKTQANIRRY